MEIYLAAEAQVAVPTVYRHFPTRDVLFQAFYAHVATDAERPTAEFPANLDAAVRGFFARVDDPADMLARVNRLSAAFEFSRVVTIPRRRAVVAQMVQQRAPQIAEPERTWLIDLGVVLLSMSMAEAFRGYLHLSGAETADRVLYAFEALLSHAAAPGGDRET